MNIRKNGGGKKKKHEKMRKKERETWMETETQRKNVRKAERDEQKMKRKSEQRGKWWKKKWKNDETKKDITKKERFLGADFFFWWEIGERKRINEEFPKMFHTQSFSWRNQENRKRKEKRQNDKKEDVPPVCWKQLFKDTSKKGKKNVRIFF